MDLVGITVESSCYIGKQPSLSLSLTLFLFSLTFLCFPMSYFGEIFNRIYFSTLEMHRPRLQPIWRLDFRDYFGVGQKSLFLLSDSICIDRLYMAF